MEEEIFAPLLTIHVYSDDQREETIQTLDQTSPYALTGAVFARDRYVINQLDPHQVEQFVDQLPHALQPEEGAVHQALADLAADPGDVFPQDEQVALHCGQGSLQFVRQDRQELETDLAPSRPPRGC